MAAERWWSEITKSGTARNDFAVFWSKRMPDQRRQCVAESHGTVAYILKGFPRLSETFISSEIYRMEQKGLKLRLYVIKPCDEQIAASGIIGQIKAQPVYLPATTSLSKAPLLGWLRQHFKHFAAGLWHAFLWRPLPVLRAAAAAFAQAVRARKAFWAWPRKVYLKEFLQAAMIADQLRQAPDVRHIHAHFCHGATTVAWLASKMSGIPFSFTAHAKDLYSPTLNPAGLLRRKMDAACFVVTCTDANRDYLQALGSCTPVYCIYHGLNADFTSLLQQDAAKHTNGHVRALAVGRLVRKKGFDVFVDACAILKQQGVSFEACIVGERGDHDKEIRQKIHAHGLTKEVRVAGPMAQPDLYREYRTSTVFCLPCRVLDNGDRDGIPNVLLEAMACGLPVISTGVSGIPEAIEDGVNGLLVPPDDPKSLADALLTIKRDRELANRLGAQAKSTVDMRFNADVFADRMARLLREAAL
jgi:glycosyltransferase involved in cell wall biosynthesis